MMRTGSNIASAFALNVPADPLIFDPQSEQHDY